MLAGAFGMRRENVTVVVYFVNGSANNHGFHAVALSSAARARSNAMAKLSALALSGRSGDIWST
jgi:hypothetical protein